MSAFTDAWEELYAQQTAVTGEAITATITGYATNKPAIVSALDVNSVIVDGGVAEAGGFSLQMLASDFSGEPPKGTPVTAGGSADGHALEVLSVNVNNGIFYITTADYAAQE